MRPPIIPLPAATRGRRPGILFRPTIQLKPADGRCAAPNCCRYLRPEVDFPKRLYSEFGLAPAGFCSVKCVATYNWQILITQHLGPLVSNSCPTAKETQCRELRPPHVLTLPPPRLLPPSEQ